jgi:ABC-type transporter Mla subunit MlaD
VAGARDLNQALPVLNQRGDELTVFLDQATRLSRDVADILEANQPFLEKVVTEGGKTLQVLDDNKAQIAPLIVGLRQFVEILAEAGRIPRGDGTTMAAIKLVFGEDCPTGQVDGCGNSAAAATAQGAGANGAGAGTGAGLVPLQLPVQQTGLQGLVDLIGGVLR